MVKANKNSKNSTEGDIPRKFAEYEKSRLSIPEEKKAETVL